MKLHIKNTPPQHNHTSSGASGYSPAMICLAVRPGASGCTRRQTRSSEYGGLVTPYTSSMVQVMTAISFPHGDMLIPVEFTYVNQ